MVNPTVGANVSTSSSPLCAAGRSQPQRHRPLSPASSMFARAARKAWRPGPGPRPDRRHRSAIATGQRLLPGRLPEQRVAWQQASPAPCRALDLAGAGRPARLVAGYRRLRTWQPAGRPARSHQQRDSPPPDPCRGEARGRPSSCPPAAARRRRWMRPAPACWRAGGPATELRLRVAGRADRRGSAYPVLSPYRIVGRGRRGASAICQSNRHDRGQTSAVPVRPLKLAVGVPRPTTRSPRCSSARPSAALTDVEQAPARERSPPRPRR